MFDIVFVLRLVTGLFSLAALAAFARAVLPTIEGEEEKRAFVRYLPLFGFLPYLFVRTSSETFSAAFFALALAVALDEKFAPRLALAGLFCGLAFESRYQTGLLGLGLVRLAGGDRRACVLAGLAAFLGGGLVALAIGAMRRPLGLWRLGVSAARLCRCQSGAGRGGASVRARAGLCLSLSAAGADLLRHHLRSDGGDGGDVAAQSPPCRDLGDVALRAGAYPDRPQGSALSVSAGDPGHRLSGAGLFAAPAALAGDLRPPVGAGAEAWPAKIVTAISCRGDGLFRALSLWGAAAHADGAVSVSALAWHGLQLGCALPVLSASTGPRVSSRRN